MPKLYTMVDRKDTIIGYKTKSETSNKDIYRVSGILIYNSHKEFLLAKRAPTKKHNSGKWGMSAAGGVEKGESYLQNIIKEVREELGLSINKGAIKKGQKIFVNDQYPFYYQQFFYKIDPQIKEIIFNTNEVEEIKWYTLDKLIEEIQKFPDTFLIETQAICEDFIKNFPNYG